MLITNKWLAQDDWLPTPRPRMNYNLELRCKGVAKYENVIMVLRLATTYQNIF